MDDLGLHFAHKPVAQLGDLFLLTPLIAAQHGEEKVAQLVGLSLRGEARHPAKQPWRVEKTIEKPGRTPEQGRLLLQVNVDAAEEDAPLTNVFLISADRRISR